MATPKASTLQQKLGFRDGDLKTPKHDEMMLWLDANMARFLLDNDLWTPQKASLAEFERQQWQAQRDWRLKNFWIDAQLSDMADIPEAREQIKITWEYPITSGKSKYMIGFIDMLVQAWGNYEYHYSERDEEWSVFSNWQLTFCIEIKTKIPSMGELVRQIRTYQTHIPYCECRWIVVCPDDCFKEPLASQGITLIKYTGGASQGKLL